MKIKCNYCGTEYNLKNRPRLPVKCVVCGYEWVVQYKNNFLIFAVMLCALLSVIVLGFVIFAKYGISNKSRLLYKITSVNIIDTNSMIIEGYILNNSKYILGNPNVIISLFNKDKKLIKKQTFIPSSTLIDANIKQEFSYKIDNLDNNVKSFSLELQGYK